MKLSEIGLMQPVLCKKAGTTWSEVFEIMKLGYSANGLAVYVRMTFGMQGQDTHSQHYWRDAADLDEKWEVFDTLSSNHQMAGATLPANHALCNGDTLTTAAHIRDNART